MEVALAVPLGSVIMYAGNDDLDNYLICDGRQISQTTYANLYAIVGDTYTTTPGALYFQIPDLRSRFIAGACGVMTSPPFGLTKYNPGDKGGSEAHLLTTNEVGAHTHDIAVSDPGHIHPLTDPGHAHTLTDPGHTHTHRNYGTYGSTGLVNANDDPSKGNNTATTSLATTGITVDTAHTNITMVSAVANVSVAISPTPTASAHENRPPYFALCYLIRVA
jgi:microcystin-dependent protein